MRVFKSLIALFLLFNGTLASVEDSPVYGYHLRIGVPRAFKFRNQESSRIIGGSQVSKADAIPYQAGIIAKLTSGWTSICGGSLITNSRVLTAAHCWYDGQSQASLFTIVLGSLTIFSGGTKRETSDVIVHPFWGSDLRHDIAVVKIAAVSFSNTIQVIPLPTLNEVNLNFEGYSGQISGFGKTKDSQSSFPQTTSLHHATVTVISNAVCQKSFPTVDLHGSHLCVSGLEGRGTCEGDSGGPLTVLHNNRRILVGVVSFGPSEGCEAKAPSVFTRVTAFLTWINAQLK